MCGLVGAVAQYDVTPILIESLRRLEHQAYDSTGVALIDGGHTLSVRRCVGKVSELEKKLRGFALASPIGIAHTRWATIGSPSERNAHPQISHNQIALVHNGSIENHALLRAVLSEDGYSFDSDTDTEVIAHLVHQGHRGGRSLFEAVQNAVRRLHGTWAIAVVSETEPDVLVVARGGSPLAVGVANDGQFVASDPLALLPFTDRFIFPEDGDVVMLKRDDVTVVNRHGALVVRPLQTLDESMPVARAA